MKKLFLFLFLIPFISNAQEVFEIPKDTLIKQVKASGWEYKERVDTLEYRQGVNINQVVFYKGQVVKLDIHEPALLIDKRKGFYDEYFTIISEFEWSHWYKGIKYRYRLFTYKETGDFKTEITVWKRH